jgi:peptide/nickel transport system permease protein
LIRFITNNIAKCLLLLVAISIIVFILVSVSPVDPVQANAGQTAYLNMSEAKRAQLAEYWGVNTPIWERYANWAKDFIHGDMGTSLRYNAPVSEVIATRALNSLALMASAWVISGLLGFISGIAAGMNRGRLIDKLVKGYCFVLASSPTFWVALIFLMIFSVSLDWFPIGFSVPLGVSAANVTIFDHLRHLILPAITLSVVGVANIALHTREKTIDVIESDYFRFALARGERPWRALRKHGLRNLMMPALTLQFAAIAEIFGGAVLVEQVFSYPGLGQAAVTAGLGGDVALLAGIAVISALFVFTGNLIANILYGVVDPRIRGARKMLGASGAVGAARDTGDTGSTDGIDKEQAGG